MKSLRFNTSLLALILLTSVCLLSCSDKKEPNATDETFTYGLSAATSNGDSYFLQTNSLLNGSVTPVNNGIELSTISSRAQLIASKDGYYYNVDFDVNWAVYRIGKYKFDGNKIQMISQIPYPSTDRTIRWKIWLDNGNLMVGGESAAGLTYDIFDVENLSVVKSGVLNIPQAPKGVINQTAEFRDNKVHMFYNYYNEDYSAADSTFMAVVDYPAMNNLTIDADVRSVNPGTGSWGPVSFVDNNNIYVLSGPTVGNGSRPDRPCVIWKIKSGETTFDDSYDLNITNLTGGDNAIIMFYAGNGKAVIVCANHTRFSTFDELYEKPVWDFYEMDVNTKTLKKLATDPSFASWDQTYVREGNKAYFTVNTAKDGPYIYEYNSESGQLTKGLKVENASTVAQLHKVK